MSSVIKAGDHFCFSKNYMCRIVEVHSEEHPYECSGRGENKKCNQNVQKQQKVKKKAEKYI